MFKSKKIQDILVYPVLALLVLGLIWLFLIVAQQSGEKKSTIGLLSDTPLIGVLEADFIIYSESARIFLEEIATMDEDDRIAGVVLRVNSPGGTITPTYEIFQALKRLSEKKTIYVSMGDVAASGGYWISLAGKKIYAAPTTITGSVGVVAETVGVEELLDKLGIEPRILKSGTSKDMGSPFRPVEATEKAFLERILKDMHQVFITAVLDNRNLDVANSGNLLDGRVFTGNQAKAFGLIDGISDYHGVLAAIKQDLDLPDAEEYKIIRTDDSLLRFIFGEKYSRYFQDFLSKIVLPKQAGFWALYWR